MAGHVAFRIAAGCTLALATLSGCSPAGHLPMEMADAALSGKAAEGATLAEALCSGCHSIEAGSLSPNPQAPQFAAIVNTPDLTEKSLAEYLRDSHNYPEQMNFEVAVEDTEALAAYMITLKSPDFEPPIQ